MSKSNRSFYRIQYPAEERPQMIIRGDRFPILNLSEEGVLLDCGAKATHYPPQQELNGSICLIIGKTLEVKGVVLRQEDGRLAVRLIEPIPLPLIMEEQRYLPLGQQD